MATHNKSRAKVYEMIDRSIWHDRGTGTCTCAFIDAIQDYSLVVTSESDDSIILSSPVLKDEQYQKQQDTLILWADKSGYDLALSFQDPAGCAEVWICEIQLQHKHQGRDYPMWLNPGTFEIPEPSMSNLDTILDVLNQATHTQYRRDLVVSCIRRHKFIVRLISVFQACEDLESYEDLHKIHHIMRIIVSIADDALFNHLVEDEVYLPVVGMFEYDSKTPTVRVDHRGYVGNPARFKQVVPLEKADLRRKVHASSRLQYLKDAVLSGTIEDSTQQALCTKIFFINMDIVISLESDHEFLGAVCALVEQADVPESQKDEAVRFVQQLYQLAKPCQQTIRASLYRALNQNGLFAVLDYALASDRESIQLIACELIMAVLECDRMQLRSYMAAQSRQAQRPLLRTIASQFVCESPPGVQIQCLEILRLLLEVQSPGGGSGAASEIQRDIAEGTGGAPAPPKPSTQPVLDPEMDQLVILFFEVYAERTVRYVNTLDAIQVAQMARAPSQVAQVCMLVCDLLSFLVRQHPFRSRLFIMSQNLITKLDLLLTAPVKHVQLAALRLVAACVGTKDNFMMRYLVRQGIIRRVMEVFRKHKYHYNLINSSCFSLFTFIYQQKLQPLIIHIGQNFAEELTTDTDYCDVPRDFMKAYATYFDGPRLLAEGQSLTAPHTPLDSQETCNEGSTVGDGGGLIQRHRLALSTTTLARRGWGTATVTDDEGAYFDTSDEEDDIAEELGVSLDSSNHIPQTKPPATDHENGEPSKTATEAAPTTTSDVGSTSSGTATKRPPRASDYVSETSDTTTSDDLTDPETEITNGVGASATKAAGSAGFKPLRLVKPDEGEEESGLLTAKAKRPRLRFQLGRISDAIAAKLSGLNRVAPAKSDSQLAAITNEDEAPATDLKPLTFATNSKPVVARAGSPPALQATAVNIPVSKAPGRPLAASAPADLPTRVSPHCGVVLTRQRSFGHAAAPVHTGTSVPLLNGLSDANQTSWILSQAATDEPTSITGTVAPSSHKRHREEESETACGNSNAPAATDLGSGEESSSDEGSPTHEVASHRLANETTLDPISPSA
ncbi:Platinum sensitivity protein, partial [Tieghemiomyces parasiticus]